MKKTARNWYKHHPGPVTILWDFTRQTERTIKANHSDIVIKDHKTKCAYCYVISYRL